MMFMIFQIKLPKKMSYLKTSKKFKGKDDYEISL